MSKLQRNTEVMQSFVWFSSGFLCYRYIFLVVFRCRRFISQPTRCLVLLAVVVNFFLCSYINSAFGLAVTPFVRWSWLRTERCALMMCKIAGVCVCSLMCLFDDRLSSYEAKMNSGCVGFCSDCIVSNRSMMRVETPRRGKRF